VQETNASQPSEPIGFVGWYADRALGILPILTIVGVLVGLSGAVYNQVTRYSRRMNELADERRAKLVASGEGSGPRFAPTESVDLPTYQVESDVA